MTEFWNHWWWLPTSLSACFSLLWTVWTAATLSAVAVVRAGTEVTRTERYWVRTVGRCVGRRAPAWLAEPSEGTFARALYRRYGDGVRQAYRANLARFLVPATLGGLAVVFGVVQYLFTLVALLGHTTGWLAVSAVWAILSLVPAYVTVVTSRRVWRRRQPFAWRVCVTVSAALVDMTRRCDAERVEASLDRIEAVIVGRYEDSAAELPSQRNMALGWNADAHRVVLARPQWSGVNDSWTGARSWVDLCCALALDAPHLRRATTFSPSSDVRPVRRDASASSWIPACIGLPVVLLGNLVLLAANAPRNHGLETLERVQELLRDPLVPNVVGLVGLVPAVVALASKVRRPERDR